MAKASKLAKEYAKKQNVLSAASIETAEAEKARLLAAEQARSKVFGLLGTAGTYDAPGTAPGAPVAPGTDYYKTGTTFGESGSPLAMAQFRGGGYSPQVAAWESRKGILDPDKYAAETAKSPMFRLASQRTAEAQQLMNREGPMWDMLENSTYGVLNEGAARTIREDIRTMRDQAASGTQSGGARNIAREKAQEAMAVERSNWELTDKTFKANIALFDLARQNMEKAMEINYRLIDNLPELRAGFSDAMSNTASMLAGTSLPNASKMMERGQIERQAHPTPSTLQKVLGGITGALQGFSSGGLVGGVLGGITGAKAEQPGVESGMAYGAYGGLMGSVLGGYGQQILGSIGNRNIGGNEEAALMSTGWGSGVYSGGQKVS